jgi:histidinol-phosphate phosphatase family protein
VRAGAFLDRDGTLIHDANYLGDPEGVRLLPGAAAAVRRLNEAGVPVLLVTNQSGIGRGYFSEEAYLAVHHRLVKLLAAEGARLDAAYHCPDPPSEVASGGCRKPGTEMFLRAARDHAVDVSRSFYVGDRLRDVAPAERLGGTAILVRSPQSEIEEAHALGFVTVVESLEDAAGWILKLIDAPAPRW